MKECRVKHFHLREKRDRDEFDDKNRVNKFERVKKNFKSIAVKKKDRARNVLCRFRQFSRDIYRR